MAKSMLHAVVGMLVARPAATRRARRRARMGRRDDGRETITLEHLLDMRDGLDFVEDYVDDKVSDVIEMLFGSGAETSRTSRPTVARSHRPARSSTIRAAPPTSCRASSPGSSGPARRTSGSSASAVRADRDAHGDGEVRRRRYVDRVVVRALHGAGFRPLRLPLHARRVWDGHRVLPEGWVDHARSIRSHRRRDRDLLRRALVVPVTSTARSGAAATRDSRSGRTGARPRRRCDSARPTLSVIRWLTDWRTRMTEAFAAVSAP